MKRHKRLIVFVVVLGILGIIFFSMSRRSKANDIVYGVSFSAEYARYLGLDPEKVWRTILDEWQFKYLRLSAQWNSLERSPGKFDFTELDSLMAEAARRGAKVILAIGQKTPRWPECHLPRWAQELSAASYPAALNNYLSVVVERYKNHAALEIWQVENEPFLPFGAKCKNFNKELLNNELALVKKLDPSHPTLVTDSGELSTWRKTARVADLFGTTMYRVVWNKYLGYWSYDWLPAAFYRFKLRLVGRSTTTAYIVELQGEPWLPDKNIVDVTLSEQYRSMDITRLQKNIAYAKSVGMPRAYLWGAEWWYWLREQGSMEIFQFIKQLAK